MQPQQQPQMPQQYLVNAPPPGFAVPGSGLPMGPPPTQLPPDKPSKWPIIGFVITLLLLVVALVFSGYAYSKMLDYKNNSDAISAKAVKVANEAQKKELEAAFAEQEKSPLKSYTTSEAYGSVKIVYPKTLARYVSDGGSNPVDLYFFPDYIPGISDKNIYSLRVQVLNSKYTTMSNDYNGAAKAGTVKVSAFLPEQMADDKNAIAGIRIDGQISSGKKGSKVMLPLRDKTIVIWTESEAGVKDFNEFVLKNLTYSP